MKESALSKNERTFILSALSENRRLDGRALDEFRDLNIHFGSDWGCCLVALGGTKVIAQVSCEVQQPKSTRPNEGLLLLFVELSPMAAPHFDSGRQTELAVQLNRLLEKCIKDSRCLDLESLCIAAEEKVWALRVDITVLNHEGNMVDAASIAALTALSHFRRPDVTTTGDQIIIHAPGERDLLAITVHHYPVCVSYAIFRRANCILADPSAIEERVSDGGLTFGVNACRELCTLHLGGHAPVTAQVVLQFASRAAARAAEVVNKMKEALRKDLDNRISGNITGFKECIEVNSRLSLEKDNFCVQLNSQGIKDGVKRITEKTEVEGVRNNEGESQREGFVDQHVVVLLGKGSAELINRKQKTVQSERNYRLPENEDSDENDDGDDDDDDDGDNEVSSSESSSSELISESSKSFKGSEDMDEALTDSEKEVAVESQKLGHSSSMNIVKGIELSGDSDENVTLSGLDKNHSENVWANQQPKSESEESNESRQWYADSMW
ncbi:hypothetical protein R5R35_011845 [Gryllus longicercus]|uniref:Exosome complex component RRP45 n=1 Tax=Gryllus longicercus TaxID=2509291 RepID=A0AAN9Z2K8_9ORTH